MPDVVLVSEDEPELEVDPDELDDEPEPLALEVELELGLDVLLLPLLVVVVVEELAAGAHDSLSDTTTPWIGRFIAEIGVPGGTFTLNV